ncbi:hypothetical protein [Priestia aryabhattai]
MSIYLKVFVALMGINLVMTGIAVLLASDHEAKYNASMWGIMIFSIIFVAFQIYIKEVLIKEHWSKVPLIIKFIWWIVFAGNSIGAIQRLMETVII